MKLYYNSATEPALVTIDGDPPVDQTALVAQLQTQVTTLTAANNTLQGKINAARVKAQADKDADAANVAGQGVLDALT